jgi:hypothetical protein
MGLNFKFIVIWKAFSTMSKRSDASASINTDALRPFGSSVGTCSKQATKPATDAISGSRGLRSAHHVAEGEAAARAHPPSTPRSTHRVAGGGGAAPAPAPAPAAAPAAATHAAGHPAPDPKRECKAFNDGKHCKYGMGCRNDECKARTATKAAASSSKPAPKAGPGDGGVSAQLTAMQKQIASIHTKVDSLTADVQTGFKETREMLTEQQQATLAMQEAMKAMMMASATLQASFTGLLNGGMASRLELPASSARLAICAASTVRSTITEVCEEKSSARGGGCSSEVCKSGGLTGADIDHPFMQICAVNRFPQNGILFTSLCELCGKTGLTDYHRCLISSIGKATNCDNLAALLFLLLTGSKQFRKSSFSDFRTACDAMLGSNRTKTQDTFSNVCVLMIKSMSDWQIAKKGGINVSNADLKDKTKHASAFDALVKNFQS